MPVRSFPAAVVEPPWRGFVLHPVTTRLGEHMRDVLATTELEEELKMPVKICSYHSNKGGGG